LIAYGVGASRLLTKVPGGDAVLARSERLLDDQGMRAVFIARLLPLARTFVSLPAGARRLPLGSFILLTTLGCGIWALVFVLIGLVSGAAWGAVSSVLGKLVLAVGLLVLALLARRRVRER